MAQMVFLQVFVPCVIDNALHLEGHNDATPHPERVNRHFQAELAKHKNSHNYS